MVALVWWVALFGSITQKAIRAAAAPMNTFAVNFDRDDLNVCKRAWENGDGTDWKFEESLKCRSCRGGRYARKRVSDADAATCADRWTTVARRVVTIAAAIPEGAADSPASS